MSSSSFPPYGIARPPRSVASGCHNHPITDPGPPGQEEVAALSRARLEAAYRSQRTPLLRYLRGRVGDDVASDLIHETFARMAESQTLHQLAQPSAYIWRVAKNLLFERSRKQKVDDAAQLRLQAQSLSVSMPEQELGIEAADLQRLFEQAVGSLTEKTRRVYLMRRFQEMSYREIADRLGISVKTVEYHMGVASVHIARILESGL